jgi:hypothetical protein
MSNHEYPVLLTDDLDFIDGLFETHYGLPFWLTGISDTKEQVGKGGLELGVRFRMVFAGLRYGR